MRRIATGGMAEIWLARDEGRDPPELVIKRMHPRLVKSPHYVMMFLDEARIASHLAHPGCVQVFDLGREGESYYIAMELIRGEDVRAIARQARAKQVPLPRKIAVAVVAGACSGLHFAHELLDDEGNPLNVVHRDVSPQNIIVTFDGRVKILDFGIAKAETQATKTQAGVLKGKYAYMSPEQVRGKGIDRRTDVWALGVLLYELTTGRRLFKGSSQLETMRRITDGDIPSPAEVSPGYPPALQEIVLKALARDKEDRYESADALRRALEAFLDRHRSNVTRRELSEFMQSLFSDVLEADEAGLPLQAPDEEEAEDTDEQLSVQPIEPVPDDDELLGEAEHLDPLDEAMHTVAGDPGEVAPLTDPRILRDAVARHERELTDAGPVEPGLGGDTDPTLSPADHEDEEETAAPPNEAPEPVTFIGGSPLARREETPAPAPHDEEPATFIGAMPTRPERKAEPVSEPTPAAMPAAMEDEETPAPDTHDAGTNVGHPPERTRNTAVGKRPRRKGEKAPMSPILRAVLWLGVGGAILGAVLFLFADALFAPPPPGLLSVTADVEGRAELDGNPIGTLPIKDLEVPAGTYQLRVITERGERAFEVEIPPGADIRRDLVIR